MEAINLHKLETRIINEGGIILDRNTDAIRYAREGPIDISNDYWDEEKTVLKYQTEDSSSGGHNMIHGHNVSHH